VKSWPEWKQGLLGSAVSEERGRRKEQNMENYYIIYKDQIRQSLMVVRLNEREASTRKDIASRRSFVFRVDAVSIAEELAFTYNLIFDREDENGRAYLD
jgi:hypothetical protein